jgi:hypothetical protein
MYFKGYNFGTTITTYIFQLDVSTCPYAKAKCCSAWLDHLLIRTSESLSAVTQALSCPVRCAWQS